MASKPCLWPPDAKSWLIWKDPDAGKDWRRGEGDDRGWDGWMASPTQWTRVWVDSGSWWWTGRPGVLRFMGSQGVGHDWAAEWNWSRVLPGWPPSLLERRKLEEHSAREDWQCQLLLGDPWKPHEESGFFFWVRWETTQKTENYEVVIGEITWFLKKELWLLSGELVIGGAKTGRPDWSLLQQKWAKTSRLPVLPCKCQSPSYPFALPYLWSWIVFSQIIKWLILSVYSCLHVSITSTEAFTDSCVKDSSHFCSSFSILSPFSFYYLLLPGILHGIIFGCGFVYLFLKSFHSMGAGTLSLFFAWHE